MKKNDLLVGVIIAALGLLLIILKGDVISIAATIFGAILIVNGVVSVINKDTTKGVILIVAGASIILFGWLFITLVLYIIGAMLIAYGVLEIINRTKVKVLFNDLLKKVIYYLIPVLYICAGGVLLFNQGEAINFVFVFSGIILLVNGIFVIIDSLKK